MLAFANDCEPNTGSHKLGNSTMEALANDCKSRTGLNVRLEDDITAFGYDRRRTAL